jgi:hypothetical protein
LLEKLNTLRECPYQEILKFLEGDKMSDNKEAVDAGIADRESAHREAEGLIECDTCEDLFVPEGFQTECQDCKDAYDRANPHPLDIAEREFQEDQSAGLEEPWWSQR